MFGAVCVLKNDILSANFATRHFYRYLLLDFVWVIVYVVIYCVDEITSISFCWGLGLIRVRDERCADNSREII